MSSGKRIDAFQKAETHSNTVLVESGDRKKFESGGKKLGRVLVEGKEKSVWLANDHVHIAAIILFKVD